MKIKKKFKLPLPAPLEYVPPFVSQKPDDDDVIDDCTWASGLMLVATWTLGEVATDKKGRPLSKNGLRALRRQLRAASGETGSSSLNDLVASVHKIWPDLRDLGGFIHGGAYKKPPYSFEDLWAALGNRSCAVLQGQRPADAEPGKLYPTKGPHAVFVQRTEGDVAYVQDPMWTHNDKPRLYQVPKAELKDFADGIGGAPNCLVVRRGGERAALRAKRDLRKELGV